jgi:hypothetical protein
MFSVRIDPNDGKYYVYQIQPDGTATKASDIGYRYQSQALDALKKISAVSWGGR